MATKSEQEELNTKAKKIVSEILRDDSQELADYILAEVFPNWFGFSEEEGLPQYFH